MFFTYLGVADEVPSPSYILKTSGKVDRVVFYDSGKIETNNLIVGATYQYKDAQLDYITGTNSTLVMSLSDDVVLGVEENSELKIHTSTVDVKQVSIPTKATLTNKNHVMSLMSGVVDVINISTNGMVLLQTPRVTIVVRQGKFRIIVQGKTTIVAAMEGVAVLQKLVDVKSGLVEAGKFAHVTTYYSLSNKGMDLANNGKATASIRPIETDDGKKMTDSFNETVKLHESFIYIVDGGKILGVKIR
jgi:hypothetical protein